MDKNKEESQAVDSALQIVNDLAAWSTRYPRNKIYGYSSKDKMDGELIALEERAKSFVSATPLLKEDGKPEGLTCDSECMQSGICNTSCMEALKEGTSEADLQELAKQAIKEPTYPDNIYPASAVADLRRKAWVEGYRAASLQQEGNPTGEADHYKKALEDIVKHMELPYRTSQHMLHFSPVYTIAKKALEAPTTEA
ncbi:MAG TPA: hypothetical protein VD794_03855 [Flavisolibacter sp.]|nr:hypothetical protein [Flavisolibacter sp.]